MHLHKGTPMKLIYKGNSAEGVVIPDPNTGKDYVAPKGVAIELPDSLAQSLIKQSIWDASKTNPKNNKEND